MLTGRELSVSDYKKMFARRKWAFIIPLILGPLLAVIIAMRLAPRYTSTSQILIDEPKVPTSFVPSLSGNNILSRLANMEEQIRSRSRLQPIMDRYGLYKSEANKVPVEQLIARMNKAIVITPVEFSNQVTGSSSGVKSQLPGFQISFTADTPQTAQAVCTEITSMFIDANLHLQEQRAVGTADFIAVQLQGAKQKLDAQDAKLAAFKRQYFGSLPDQEQSTIQLLGTLTAQLNSLTNTMNGYQQQRTYTESLLGQQLAAWKASQVTGVANPQTLQQRLTAAQANLTSLRARFTNDYPDVIKAEADVSALQKELAQQKVTETKNQPEKGSRSMNPALEPPQVHQLRASLSALKDAMAGNLAEQRRLQREIAAYEGKLKLTPAVEQQYKDLTRNYQTAQAFYNSLLQKEDESQMSSSLEQRQEGQQFTVLDPANLPQEPSFPNFAEFSAGGLIAGILIGIGVILLLELGDKSLRDEKDIEFYLGVPTLALIPRVGDGDAKRSWLARHLKLGSGGGAGATLARLNR